MDINLQNLATLQRPTMMPTTSTSSMGSVGGDAVRGGMYGQDMQQFNDTLSQISPIAQAAGQEQMQGIQDRKTLQPQQQAAAVKKMQLEALTPYASAWDAATTDKEKETIRAEIANDPNVPKQKPWNDMPLEVLGQHMKMVRAMGVNTPQHAQSMETWGRRGADSIAGKQVTAATSRANALSRLEGVIYTSDNAAKGRELLAQAMKEKQPTNIDIALWQKVQNKSATPDDFSMYAYQKQANATVAAAGRVEAQQPTPDVEKLTQGKVPMTKQPTPQVSATPPISLTKPNPTPAKPMTNQPPPDYKVGDFFTDLQNGKKEQRIIRTGKRNGKVVVQLEDGSIVDGQ